MPRRNGHQPADEPNIARAKAEQAAEEQAARWPQIDAIADALRSMRGNNDFIDELADAMRRRRPG